jgi:hypothetical protein
MSPRPRVLVPALLVVGVVVAAVALTAGLPFQLDANPGASGAAHGTGGPIAPGDSGLDPGGIPTLDPDPTPRPPLGGTELFGFLPYWQMTDSMAGYLRDTKLSTLALFSVTARRSGAVDTRPSGYRRITGDIGRRIIDEAHERGSRVELVFTSFSADKNGMFFGRIPRPTPSLPAASEGAEAGTAGTEASTASTEASTASTEASAAPPPAPPWHRTVDELIALVSDLRVDGLNIDIELLDDADRAAYGEFLVALRTGLDGLDPDLTLSVATEAGVRGTDNAVAATAAGADRVFLMGYDYHWSGSQPGASAPVDRDDGFATLRWSITRYVEAGVPRDRILLGLPLYGMQWRTLGPDRTAPVIGSGVSWIPNKHLDELLADGFAPGRDSREIAEFFVVPDGAEWLVTYYDSPATLRPKLALARDQGLAGAGFWAIGYERGLPGYLELMRDFQAGNVMREEAP